jgi:Plasmid pRiA4b ORF-3-like protein
MAKQGRVLYQIKVTLRDIDPPIWRRIQVWEDTTLSQLHQILQIVMGWEDCHLHEFMIGRRLYSIPDVDDDLYERKVVDERRHRLLTLLPRVGTVFQYLYDFGDSWHHDILWEAILFCRIRPSSILAASPVSVVARRKMSADLQASRIT